VIFVYCPAAVLFIFIIIVRSFATAEASKIVRVVIVGEP
jgi:hypothetical protein